MDSYRGYVILLFWLFFPCFIFAQKGTWQIHLEKEQKNTKSQEQKLVLQCAIAQEMKDYDLEQALQIGLKVLPTAQRLHLPTAEGEAYSVLAEVYRMRGRPLEALAYHQKALDCFTKNRQENFIQRTKRDMAFTYSTLSKFDSAQYALKSALHWFGQYQPNTREHAITLHTVAVNTLRLGYLQEAMEYCQQAEKIFNALDDSFNQTRIKNTIGLIQKNMGYYKKGFQIYTDALQAYEKMGEYQRGTAVLLINMGNVYITLHDTLYREQIFKYFERAHSIAHKIGDTLQMVACIEALAKAEAFRKNYTRANQYYEKGLRMLQKTNNYIEEGYYTLRISDIYLWQKEYQKAIDINKNALRIFEEKKTWGAVAQVQLRLARLYASAGDSKTSQYYAYQILKNAQKIGDSSILIHLYNLVLQNAINLRQFDEADKWGRQALQIFRENKKADFILETYKLLIKADTMRKKTSALQWLLLYNELRDSLLIQNRNKDVLEMQFKYDLKNQIRENQYLKEVNELNRIEAQERGVIIVAVSLVLVLMVFVAFFLYYNRQKLRKLLKLVREKNTAIIEKNSEIEAQNENLAKLNLTKDRILSVISHDMRSPLANLKAVLDLANYGSITLEEQVYMTQKLNTDIGRVHEFLQNLLFWAESQMEGFAPSIEKVALNDLVERIFNIVEQQAHTKQVELKHEIDSQLECNTDKDIISMVLLNLVSNALKFTPSAGKIRIYATEEKTYLQIAVQDTGVGIAPQYQDKIFGSSRFTTNGTNEEKGTGFGLTLCRDFMHVLGGDIHFESKLREGTTFFVKIPLK
jgi:signal transduction histidine kinase